MHVIQRLVSCTLNFNNPGMHVCEFGLLAYLHGIGNRSFLL